MLQNYFRSGWAFLIPYLAAYLLYAWLKWPVNPASGGEGLVKGMSESAGALPLLRLPSSVYRPPCLLHVYWALHALHLVLGALALRAWWKGSILNLQLQTSSPTFHAYSRTRTSAEPWDVSKHQQGTGAPSAHLPPALRSSASSEVGSALIWRFAPWLLLALRAWWLGSTVLRSPFSVLQTVAPWILLGLLFWIPGVYLEWPADPWEHLRRINEWRVLDTVTAHSTWMKSSYFIPYSLLSWCVGLRQIFWLDFYYTGICLLLCWQYYRLARACDLSERASMVFVLLQALLFGNNIFSFYRYYGISSSIYAQLGAVALTRIVLEAAKHPQLSLRSFFSAPHFISRLIVHRQPPALRSSAPSEVGSDLPPTAYRSPSTAQPPTVYSLLLTGIPLLTLTAFNHVQGIGVFGLSLGSIVIWRLLAWKKSIGWWLIIMAISLSIIVIMFLPRHPSIDTVYRADSWLTTWYGFNFAWTSPASYRAMQIFGVFGAVNILAGLMLLLRNQIAGWLTLGPILALSMPFVALPLANSLAANSADGIITFPRMLFGIPPGLASIIFFRSSSIKLAGYFRQKRIGVFCAPLFSAVICSVLILVSNSGSNYYNRCWHFLYSTPRDLNLTPILSIAESTAFRQPGEIDRRTITTVMVANALNASNPRDFPHVARDFYKPIVESAENLISLIISRQTKNSPEQGNLIRDPLASDELAWTTLEGGAANFITLNHTLHGIKTALCNPSGQPLRVLASHAIHIDQTKKYCLEISVRQSTITAATNYLCVAWYSDSGALLVSNQPTPLGSGSPSGWSNGTFSYFGLVAANAPNMWATYRITFGHGEAAAIPINAKYLRVGAMLNYDATPNAIINLTNVCLREQTGLESVKSGIFPQETSYRIIIPLANLAFSPTSQASNISHHWLPQQVAANYAGNLEILNMASGAGMRQMEPKNIIYMLDQSLP